MPASADTASLLSRSERRKRRTRRALIGAARTLARQTGADAVTIQEITEAADVGLGTFYNYFGSKTELFEAVLLELNREFFAELDELQAGVKDPAMAFTFTLRFAMQQVLEDTDWARFTVRSGIVSEAAHQMGTERLRAEIRRAVAAGRFQVEDPQLALLLIHSLVGGIELAPTVYGYAINTQLFEQALHYILKMLGMNEREARSLATVPLPDRA